MENTTYLQSMNLTIEQIRVLLNGLTSLEGALGALNEPMPENIPKLRNALLRQEQLLSQHSNYLTTQQVATQLGCSSRRVRQLGEQGIIHLVRQGRRGRGFSNLYDTQSVEAYKKTKAISYNRPES